MAWNPLTSADVLAEMTPIEAQTLNNIAAAQPILDKVCLNVVNAARGSIQGGGNQLDQAGTVPDQLRDQLMDLILWRWLIKFPQMKAFQTPERKAAAEECRRTLKDISKKDSDYRVELPAPATALSTAAPVNAVQIARPGRHVRTNTYDDLSHT